MDYQLSDDEFSRLVSCANQIEFINDLCCCIEGQHSLSIEGLQSFLSAQQEVLKSTVKKLEERFVAQRALDAESGVLMPFDWMHALRIARGDARHTPSGTEQRITQKLAKAASIDDEMRYVLDEWTTTLAACSTAGVPAQPVTKRRRREKLVQEAA